MRTFSIIAAQDMPSFGSYTLEAADPEAALAAAKAMLLADQSGLCEREPEGVHSLRIVSLQEDDEDPLFWDVSLDPDAPFWPGASVRRALLATTRLMAEVLVSLEEPEAYLAGVAQLEANLRLLAYDFGGCESLAAARPETSPRLWLEQVMAWALAPPPRVGS